MPTFSKIKGVQDYYDYSMSDNLESNLIMFFDYGLLGLGAFGNNYIADTSGNYYGDLTNLIPIRDSNFTNGRVWQGKKDNWVWESGIEYSNQPIQISGVYVNSQFYPSNTTGVYAHHIDYENGRVIFDSPVANNKTVQVEHSYRLVTIESSDVAWFRQLQFDSFKPSGPLDSGLNNVLSQNRVQLPAVVVDVSTRQTIWGFELGGTNSIRKEVMFHVYAENAYDKNNIMDIISFQQEKTIPMYDKNLLARNNRFPIDYNGSIASGALCFPDLTRPSGEGGFHWKDGTFISTVPIEVINPPPLYMGKVRCVFEVVSLLV